MTIAPVKAVVAITEFLFRSFPLFLSNINFTFANLSKNIQTRFNKTVTFG